MPLSPADTARLVEAWASKQIDALMEWVEWPEEGDRPTLTLDATNALFDSWELQYWALYDFAARRLGYRSGIELETLTLDDPVRYGPDYLEVLRCCARSP